MAKATKKRAEKYEPKVSFEGTFEDMIGISVKDAERKVTAKKGERETPELIIGNQYYFHNGKKVESCILKEIYFEGEKKRITIKSKDGLHSLYPDEIGATPEQANQNRIV